MIKSLARRLAPRIALDTFRALREARYKSRSPFSGVYARWEDVPLAGGQFDDDEWALTAYEYSRSAMARNENAFVPAGVTGENALLPLLAAVSSQPLSILDFGGATGFGYIALKYGAMDRVRRYVIVEHEKICARGRELFPKADFPNVEFVTEAPDERFDLVMNGSALQYLKDYKGWLQGMAAKRPRWFLFTKSAAGYNRTFVTAQVNLPGKMHPHWLFNARELAEFMESIGYHLVFKSAVDGEINQDAFAPQYRLRRSSNLLFASATATP